jgi:hypothetical protein
MDPGRRSSARPAGRLGAFVRFDRFDRRAVAWSLRCLGAALGAEVATQAASGVWRVNAGELYPWRHLPILPLEPPWALGVEWAAMGGAALALLAGVGTRAALRVAALASLVSVLERYSNHGALLFLVTLYFAMAPPDVSDPSFEDRDHPNLGLARAQLVIVYAFSALNKLTHGFASGASLENLLGLPHAPAVVLSVATLAAEIALPLLLMARPRVGVAAVALLHACFALVLPGLYSFGLAMLAMSLLFLRPRPALRHDRGS